MSHRNQHTGSTAGTLGWLTMLVDTFEAAERLGDTPCDGEMVSEVRARLARPATACSAASRETHFDLQH